MPAKLQKFIDKILESVQTKFAFHDDILIIKKSSLRQHQTKTGNVVSLLDKESLSMKLQKCEFGKAEQTWLGFKKHPNEVIPTMKKRGSIINLEFPTTKTNRVKNGNFTIKQAQFKKIAYSDTLTSFISEKDKFTDSNFNHYILSSHCSPIIVPPYAGLNDSPKQKNFFAISLKRVFYHQKKI